MKVSPDIESLKPYEPGKPESEVMREYGLEKVIKLASNENPLGPSPKAVEAIKVALSQLHRYPDASNYELKKIMAEDCGVAGEELLFGNGSNELIDLLIRVFCEPGDTVLTSQGAFIAYKICAQAARVKVEETPLTPDLKFDLVKLSERISDSSKPTPKIIFIANPNNPTGTYLNGDELSQFLKSIKGRKDLLVVLDEAYLEFVRAEDYQSGLHFYKDNENLVLLRTMSKTFGLAGLRIGTMIARPEILNYIHRVRNPFNVNSLAQVAAVAALKDLEFIKESQKVTWEGLDYFYRELEALGLKFWPSQANFVLFDAGRDSKEIHQALLSRGIIMRPVAGYGFPQYLRLSVGLMKENEVAIKALKEVVK